MAKARYDIKGSGLSRIIKGKKEVLKGKGVSLDEEVGDALVARRLAVKCKPDPKPEQKKKDDK